MDNLNNRYVTVQERIFTLLKEKSIQQKDFAKVIGVHEGTLSKWKKGKNISFVKQLDIIAEALGTTEEWLLYGGEGSPPPRRKKEPPPEIRGGLSAEPLDPDEKQLIHDYRTLNTQGQEYIRQTMHMAVQIYKKSSDLSKLEG